MGKLNSRISKLEQEDIVPGITLVIGEGEKPTEQQEWTARKDGLPILEQDVLKEDK